MSNILTQCPKCGGDIVENEKNYGCANWRDQDGGCRTTIWKDTLEKLGKKAVTKGEAKELFENGKTSNKVKLHSAKKNKDFEAYLILDDDNRVQLSFED